MRAVVQRVRDASVTVDGAVTGAIDHGLLVYLGVEDADDDSHLSWLCDKLAALRIFPDDEGRMNRSVVDVGGGVLVVSQFTLFASTRKGTRPSFARAGKPDHARALYEAFLARMATLVTQVGSGVFAAHMDVAAINDGPVTITIDSHARE